MCGIAGFWGPSAAADGLRGDCQAMTAAVQRRGPDGDGHWVDADRGVALGHRRLAILDLSETGRQPMASADGRFVMVYNGEAYDFEDLRADLLRSGAAFRGSSDTEVLLEGFSRWGIEATLAKVVGMFALAVFDRDAGRLVLARDRLGEKPLYYGQIDASTFAFGSDLAALAAHPAFRGALDHDALALYLRYGHVPAPRSILAGIHKLPPGCFLELDGPAKTPMVRRYWDAVAVATAAQAKAPPVTDLDGLDRLLRRTVRRSMVSDVPLGAFLSGGIDSSLVAALMQAESPTPVHTFTIGFHEAAYNEAEWAAKVARHLGTQHTELFVTSEQARAVIPDLPTIYHEPFADSSQIPTFLVSRLARQHVTVALSGDGGDELFGGYTRYVEAAPRIERAQRLPRPLRRAAARTLTSLPNAALQAAGRACWPLLRPNLRKAVRDRAFAERVKRFAATLQTEGPEEHYQRLVSTWPNPNDLLVHNPGARSDERLDRVRGTQMPLAQRMMLLDALAYLPDDILAKVDRAAMAVSLEARAPLLSHEVFAAAWALPLRDKVRDGKGKWALREVLHRYVPRDLVERPKAGFGVPIDSWLRGPLRAWAEELLSVERLRRDGLLQPRPIRAAWLEHLSGRRDRHHELWIVLMFNAWLDAHRHWFKEGTAPR